MAAVEATSGSCPFCAIVAGLAPAAVVHAIEGGATLTTEDGASFTLGAADTACTPGYTAVTLANASAREPAFLFVADEAPLHRKLGVYETRT